ncbi:hypothetical protein ABKN59_006506 [Abortiporus biennis]
MDPQSIECLQAFRMTWYELLSLTKNEKSIPQGLKNQNPLYLFVHHVLHRYNAEGLGVSFCFARLPSIVECCSRRMKGLLDVTKDIFHWIASSADITLLILGPDGAQFLIQ